MHPILAAPRRLALYLGLWALAGVLLAALLVAQVGFGWASALLVSLPLAWLYAFVCLSAWYVARGMPLSATASVRIVATALTASAIASAGWIVAARIWIRWLLDRAWLTSLPRGTAGLDTVLTTFGILIYLLWLAIAYLVAVFDRTRQAERRELQVQVLARESELRLLRAQIDPHFLFNSLHSISALTATDAAAARRMCLLLADFLRESLALGAQDRITLAREVSLVERFLAVERVRFGDRLAAAIEVAPEAETCLVPPLLLQPLVENAITHGIAHIVDGGTISVRASRDGGRLRVWLMNPCDPDRPRRAGAGVGIANVRARLAALHGDAAQLSVKEEGGVWRTELSLPAVVEAV
jgi:two-component system sensor histidine kinase AlgZ